MVGEEKTPAQQELQPNITELQQLIKNQNLELDKRQEILLNKKKKIWHRTIMKVCILLIQVVTNQSLVTGGRYG